MRIWTNSLLVALLAMGTLVEATTIIAPRDIGELACSSDAVVLARASSSTPRRNGRLIHTETEFVVEECLSGDLSASKTVSVEVPGGTIGNERWVVPGSPAFEDGQDYLLFLQRDAEGLWRPTLSSYGLMKAVRGKRNRGLLIPLSESRSTEVLPPRDGNAFERVKPCYYRQETLTHLRDVVERASPWSSISVVAPIEELAAGVLLEPIVAGCEVFSTASGRNYRWNTFDSNGVATISGAAPDGVTLEEVRLVAEAMSLWMEIEGTGLNLAVGRESEPNVVCTRREDLSNNVVLFDDPCSDIPNLRRCSGVLAYGGPLSRGTHTFDGDRWATISGWAVVVNNGTDCLGIDHFRLMLAHELGHGLGFGHVADSRALMYERCCNDINATDAACTRSVYPAVDPENRRPQVDAGDDTDVAGSELTLGGAVDDDLATGSGVTVTWRLLHGPVEVEFEDSSALDTMVHFRESGSYLLSLTAFDGQLLATDTVKLDVDVTTLPAFRRGDANVDSFRDLSDAVFVLRYLFVDATSLRCLKSADTDDSGVVDVADATHLLAYLFRAGARPSPPFDQCGLDPTVDTLTCESFSICQ